MDQAGAEQAREAVGKEGRQAEGYDEPDIEEISSNEPMEAVFHCQPAQQRGHEGGEHYEPPSPAADAERQGRQQRTGRGDRGHPGHPVAVGPARVAHAHAQHREDHREEVPPLVGEHAHDDHQPQHDRHDDASAQSEPLPVELEQLRHLVHDRPLGTLAWGRGRSPAEEPPGANRGPVRHPRRGRLVSFAWAKQARTVARPVGQPLPLAAKVLTVGWSPGPG